MASLIKRKWNSQHCSTLWQRNLHKVAASYFLLFMYMVQLYKKIGQSCICCTVGPPLQSNSSNCLVLILHRQLGNCLLCSKSCCSVSVLIILPDSFFLYTKLACSLVKYCPIPGVVSFISPPILGLRGKNVVVPFLPFIHLNDSLFDFLLNLPYLSQLVCLTLGVLLIAHLLNLTFVETVQFPFLL